MPSCGRVRRKARPFLVAAVVLLVVDSAVCLLLWRCAGAPAGPVFSSGVADAIALILLRHALVILFGVLGFHAWRRVQPREGQGSEAPGSPAQTGDTQLRNLGGSLLSDAEAPSSSSSPSITFSNAQLEGERARAERSRRGERWRDVSIWAIFAVCSLAAAYIGIKCVSFGVGDAFANSGSAVAVLLAVEVFLCHGEFYASKKLLVELTTADGLVLPWLHPHTLYFVERADARMCQTCRSKIQHSNHNAMAYFCPLCERHHYCIACLKRQTRQRQSVESGANGQAGDLQEASRVAAQQSSAVGYLRRVLPLLKPLMHIVIVSLLTVGANQGVKIITPKLQGHVLDSVVKADSASFQRNITMYFLVNLATGFLSSLQSSAVLLVMRRLAFQTRLTVFKHILRQDIAYFDANLAGQICSRLTNDVNQMTDPVSILMQNLLSNCILMVGGLFMCFETSWKMSTLAMTAIFPISYLVRAYSEWAGKISRKIMDEMSEANGSATQAIQNMRTVRHFGAEAFELQRYEGSLTNVYNLQMKDNLTRIANQTFTSYLDLAIGVFVLWYGGGVIIHGDEQHFSLGQLITFQLYWNMMKNAFSGLNDVLGSLMRATSASQRVLDLLDLSPTIETGKGTWIEDKEQVKGDLVFDHVTFHYTQKRSERPVLSDICLSLPSGKVTAVVGKSGGGKSTMASLLLRLYDPIAGSITLDGRDFRSYQPQSLRALFGVVAQETQLFAGTVEDNIAYAYTESYTNQDLEEACRKANALEFIEKCEDGFQTLVGDRGMLLSGGQKQRVSIARMFLRKPRLLLLDEATSALDAENEALVQKALDGLIASGICRTVVVIAHRLSTVRDADQIAVMEDGELKELGSHEALLQHSAGIYAQLVERQLHPKAEPANTEGKGKKGRDGNTAP